jgi:hypothetical protein
VQAPSALPGISPTGGEIGWAHQLCQKLTLQHEETFKWCEVKAACDLPTCGGDARQGRGGRHIHWPSSFKLHNSKKAASDPGGFCVFELGQSRPCLRGPSAALRSGMALSSIAAADAEAADEIEEILGIGSKRLGRCGGLFGHGGVLLGCGVELVHRGRD